MSEPLLTTKLYLPPVRPELVHRPRLIMRLNDGLDRKLTLISAPAGFGKTTLISECAARCDPNTRVAWLSLDENDSDLVLFLRYVIAAVQTLFPEACPETSSLLKAPQLPPQDHLAAPDIRPGERHIVAGGHRTVHPDPASCRFGVLHHHHGIGASGHHSSGGDHRGRSGGYCEA